MFNEICICCAEKMTASSPRNPNICASCEQLLDSECAELERLLASGSPGDGRGQSPARAGVFQKVPDDFFLTPADE
jgi:hypothetical protein